MRTVQFSGMIEQPFTIHEFTLDERVEWLEIQIEFHIKKWQHVFLWDPNDRLRWQYVNVHAPKTIILHSDDKLSDYSTLPGELPQGTWRLEVLVEPDHLPVQHQINLKASTGSYSPINEWTNDAKQYWADVNGEAPMQANLFSMEKVKKKEAAWYRGDFHTHTVLTDGKMTAQQGMMQAKKQNLDFFVATDHNLLPTMWVEDEDVLVIPGIEITSSRGHFNALGLTSWVDWRPTHLDGGMESEQGMNRVISEVRDHGALFSVNHPMLTPYAWLFMDTKLSDLDSFEVWNDPTFPDNRKATEEALVLWNELWNDGYCVCGIGGSDSHMLPTESYVQDGPPSLIGDPATYVYSSELSAKAILQSVKERKVYVTRGPVIEQVVEINSKQFSIGSDVSAIIDEEQEAVVHFKVTVQGMAAGTLYWIENGEIVEQHLIDGSSEYKSSTQWKTGEFVWRRVEIRNEKGELMAFTNPVFSGQKAPSIEKWGELLTKAGLA
ncbi:hypothetical protein CEW92_11775 [Bacillaceae bacterium SAS-127]|nr:hypothetical protein CEW92_11775 [Bacillaceae bacterium SAS-127]